MKKLYIIDYNFRGSTGYFVYKADNLNDAIKQFLRDANTELNNEFFITHIRVADAWHEVDPSIYDPRNPEKSR